MPNQCFPYFMCVYMCVCVCLYLCVYTRKLKVAMVTGPLRRTNLACVSIGGPHQVDAVLSGLFPTVLLKVINNLKKKKRNQKKKDSLIILL